MLSFTMEGKRKYLYEPHQHQSTSKFGRKVSRFVFNIVQGDSSKGNQKAKLKNPYSSEPKTKHTKIVSQIDGNIDTPSIVLCDTDISSEEPVLEHHLNITPHFVTKKIKITHPFIPNIPLKLKQSHRHEAEVKRDTNTPETSQTHLTTNNQLQKDQNFERIQPNGPADDLVGRGKKKQLRSRAEQKVDKIVEKKVCEEEIRLKAEHLKLSKCLSELNAKVQTITEIEAYHKERLSLRKLKQNQEMLYYYIGFKDESILDSIVFKLSNYLSEQDVTNELLVEDQLLITLMKLRRNYSMHDLAFRFRVSLPEADRIVFNTVLALHEIYYEQDLKSKPFSSVPLSSLPEQFACFPNCRVVLESVRVSCEDPNTKSEAEFFTSTKFDPKITLKGLLGISPTKMVLFASNLYKDSTPNDKIFKDSGILAKLEAGDLIMADKSYEIFNCLPSYIDLNVPSMHKSELVDKEFKNLNSKARAYIGRTSMQHLRRFYILNHIPSFLNSIAVHVFQLCSTLVNFHQTAYQSEPCE